MVFCYIFFLIIGYLFYDICFWIDCFIFNVGVLVIGFIYWYEDN